MFSAESKCAIDLASDAAETSELFTCTPCGVRARLDSDGIVEVITRNICKNLTFDACASSESSSMQLQSARRPEFNI
jgi:hypothetical protein